MTVGAEQIVAWLCDSALPLWSSAGLDATHGGFFDDLRRNGTPLADAPKRLRVQARQIYVFSHAHVLGWQSGPDRMSPLDAAADGFDFMTRHYWRDDPGGFVYATGRDGTVTDPTVELYEQAFALFACAWYFRASGDARAVEWAEGIWRFLDSHMADAVHGGYFETLARDLPRRQNPHMHLLEAALAQHEARGDAAALARARDLVDLFRRFFFDAETMTLGEFFDGEWKAAEGAAGQIVEPGHHFEWTWLLHQYGAASGDDCSEMARQLYDTALRRGVDADAGPTQGLIVDSLHRHSAQVDGNKRLWAQTEAIKAHAARLEWAGDDSAGERLDEILERLFACHLQDDSGLWREHLSRTGAPLRDTVPATSLYHLFLALSEVLRVRDGVTSL